MRSKQRWGAIGAPLPDYLTRAERVRRRVGWVVYGARYELRHALHPRFLLPRLRRVCDALRSALAHIRLQFDTNCGIDSRVESGDECHWTPEWMDARDAGIETLRASCPWIDFVDAQMYLEGFEAGVRFGIRSQKLNSPWIQHHRSHNPSPSNLTAQSKLRTP